MLAGLADRALVMNGGRVVEEGPVARLLAEPREEETRELVEGVARVGAPVRGDGPAQAHEHEHERDKEEPVLSVRDLAVTFPVRRGFLGLSVGTVRAVDGISFDVARGEALGVVGESGSGKSTAARAILRLVPARGVVQLAGQDLSALDGAALRRARRDAQMIFQDPYASLDPRMTVLESVAEPLVLHGLARSRRDATPAVAALLESVELDPRLAGRYPHELSGGQRQRVGIARAVALRPRILFADEPVSALDAGVRAQIVELLGALSQEHGLALVLISHDLAAIRRLARRVAVMYLGRIVELAPAAAIFAAPAHPYTRALLAAAMVPPLTDRPHDRRRLVLAGEVPSPEAPPPGCAFHPRCPEAETRCRTEVPALTARGDRWAACHLAT